MLLEKIEELLKEVSTLSAQNAEEVEQLRLKYLSKKGSINALMADFRTVPADQKKTIGVKINELKQAVTERINALKEQMEEADASSDDIDLTRTAYPVALGTRHPLTVVKNQIIDIFSRMGFTLYHGPEVDDDKHVFTMLNFAADHPARDMQDTFFIEQSDPNDVTKNILLRSHTSGDEAHYMETHEPPIRVLCPGRVYRNEAISARAHCFFHQVEGLYVDKNVSFTDLKQVLLTFAREMFGADTKIRLRPSYFPFTEPSAEMDISCNICGGKGCNFCKHDKNVSFTDLKQVLLTFAREMFGADTKIRLRPSYFPFTEPSAEMDISCNICGGKGCNFCKHTGWVEILGCGMVDPHDLEACGIDSNVYTGYAFGMGVERITNLKYRVSDLRLFSENDTRFLREFESAK
jgi:phenylalanyl-tRNA synthetase alpha chain